MSDMEGAARRLLERANEDPVSARQSACELAAEALDGGLFGVAAIALRAEGLAAAYLDDIAGATDVLRRAAAAARRAGDETLVGEVEMTLGSVLYSSGAARRGLGMLTRAIGRLGGAARARALVQRGGLYQRAADFERALADFEAAVGDLEASDDRVWLARLHANRGLCLAYRGSLEAAEGELVVARDLYADLGHAFGVTRMIHNRGWVAAQLGDIPRALASFDEAQARYEALGSNLAALLLDRSEALISAHLVDEAHATALAAAAALGGGGHEAARAEALVLASQAALLADKPADAAAAAAEAMVLFATQERTGWARYAETLELRAGVESGRPAAASWRRAAAIAGELEDARLVTAGLHARVLAADLALAGGDLAVAADQLSAVQRRGASGPIDLSAAAWRATAELRLGRGDRRGAAAAVAAGLSAVERHQAALGATETRAHAAGHARRLGAMGVEMAWESGDPRRLLAWMERTRAGALRQPPVRVPDDAGLAADLAELRHVERRLRGGTLDGAAHAVLERRRRRLEEAVKRTSRRAQGESRRRDRIEPGELLGDLGDMALLEFGRVGERLVAVTATNGRVRRHDGPPIAQVAEALDAARFGLRRLAGSTASVASRRAAEQLAAEGLNRLDALLLAPYPIGDRELLLVPPAALHALPWSLLPSATGRSLTVSPSALLWMRRGTVAAGSARVVVNGPRLPHAAAEVRALGSVYAGVVRLDARTGTVEAVRRAIDGAALAHLACHGRFRSDNPLFSALEMADGWLTVYDFESLAACPQTVVLSACDAGISAERPGDEVMGIVAGLLGAGARTVVASVGLVPDASGTRRVMLDFHRRLAAGAPPARALAGAQEAARVAGDLASASFVCFGRG